MKISVIVPIYNVETYVGKCIESIINQGYQNIEIILVDDGSTDNSGKICDEYAEKDARIIVIHKNNGGVVSARKKAGEIATGEYIASVDGDDWIEDTYIENFVKEIRNTNKPVIWSVSYYKEFDLYAELCMPAMLKKDNYNLADFQKNALQLVSGYYGFQNDIEYSICWQCIRKDLYNHIQMQVDERIHRGEDVLFSLILLNTTDEIGFIRNDGYHYVQRKTSVTYDKEAYSKSDYRRLEKSFLQFSKIIFKEKKSMNRIINGFLVSTYMLYFFGELQNDEMNYLYPFNRVIPNSKIAVYGAGNIGQNVVSYLKDSEEYELVAWVDSKTIDKRIGKWEVHCVNYIEDIEFDYIILATSKTVYIEQMRDNLNKIHIQRDKVITPFDGI